ncbi:hypothetical protein AVEN_40314-1 [Araneus ventricosus]|uniref:Uncharacterized protein n=1 Tax=Araneus ventricosus TaxID=182803 RepID=A0A4Y2VTF9_ARAVE|nr:hypothetical protein AVEN_40314-1 [Araneus ventricosus]
MGPTGQTKTHQEATFFFFGILSTPAEGSPKLPVEITFHLILHPELPSSPSNLPSNPKKSLREAPKLNDHWSMNNSRDFSLRVSSPSFQRTTQKGSAAPPPREFAETQSGKDPLFVPFLRRKKNGEEKEYVFLNTTRLEVLKLKLYHQVTVTNVVNVT